MGLLDQLDQLDRWALLVLTVLQAPKDLLARLVVQEIKGTEDQQVQQGQVAPLAQQGNEEQLVQLVQQVLGALMVREEAQEPLDQ